MRKQFKKVRLPSGGKPKAKRPSRGELRRTYLLQLHEIVARHVSAGWREGCEFSAKRTPNASVKQYNNDFCYVLIREFNFRRDWSKFTGKREKT